MFVYIPGRRGTGKGFLSVFCFVDRITELKKDETLTAFYTLSGREEFLKDHFVDFPVMPGVLLLESLKQAAAALLGLSAGSSADGRGRNFYRLARVADVKFGQFVRPDSELRLFVRFLKKEGALNHLDGRIDLASGGVLLGKALSASLTLAPVCV